MRLRPLVPPAVVVLALVLAGCGVPKAQSGVGSLIGEEGKRPAVVVLLDTGINPYHEMFRIEPRVEAAALANLSVGFRGVSLTRSGTLGERYASDQAAWSSLRTGLLYHFEGTRVFAISFLNGTPPPLQPDRPPIRDYANHGTGTASVVATLDPDAIIVMAQINADVCTRPDCVINPDIAEALNWTSRQPWVDVVSMSLNFPGNAPDSSILHAEKAALLAASKAASDSGKLLVASAGNEPTLTLSDYITGPPWVIAAGGWEGTNNGESAGAAKGVDVVANYTQRVADASSLNETRWTTGTSFSAPTVAGALSRAITLLREHALTASDLRVGSSGSRSVTATDLRLALNATAQYMSPRDYDPTPSPQGDPILGRAESVAIPAVLPTQQGWGVVDSRTGEAMVDGLIGSTTDTHSSLVAAYQAQWQATRVRYWDSIN